MMDTRDLTLIQSTIDHGHIVFARSDESFFPRDALGDRGRKGARGVPVYFSARESTIETDIRIMSGVRLSPRTSFMPYLKAVRARAGDLLHITRIGDRDYLVEYVRCVF